MEIFPVQFIETSPPRLDAGNPAATAWQDARGNDVAFATTCGAWHWLRVVGAGSFRFPVTSQARSVRAEVVPENASTSTVVDSYYRTVVPIALQAYGLETLHGSAVNLPGGVVALCAQPETGKSTIAYALRERGHEAVADDSVIVSLDAAESLTSEAATGRPLIHPLPFALRLRQASAKHFSSPSKASVRVEVGHRRVATGLPLELAAVVMLHRRDGLKPNLDEPAVTLRRLAPNEAFTQLLAQSLTFSLADKERKRAMVRTYLQLAAATPVYGLSYPTGLEHLKAICDRLEGLAAAPEAARDHENPPT